MPEPTCQCRIVWIWACPFCEAKAKAGEMAEFFECRDCGHMVYESQPLIEKCALCLSAPKLREALWCARQLLSFLRLTDYTDLTEAELIESMLNVAAKCATMVEICDTALAAAEGKV